MRLGRGAKVPGRAQEGGGQEAGDSPGGHGGIRAVEGADKAAGGQRKEQK